MVVQFFCERIEGTSGKMSSVSPPEKDFFSGLGDGASSLFSDAASAGSGMFDAGSGMGSGMFESSSGMFDGFELPEMNMPELSLPDMKMPEVKGARSRLHACGKPFFSKAALSLERREKTRPGWVVPQNLKNIKRAIFFL
jgi:hypothetical protein